MGIYMAGLDHNTAGVSVRERFSLTSSGIREVLADIKLEPYLQGCVLLSTCNRTELYLSWVGDIEPEGAHYLCRGLGLKTEEYSRFFTQRKEEDAIYHLMQVAGGLCSQILGEDQILTQVKTAIELAREEGCADAELQTLFRLAITAGKGVKTSVVFPRGGSSVAKAAVDTLESQLDGLEGKKALVIGNGEMGQLAADILAKRGCDTVVTLRAYRHGTAVLPDRCGTVVYEERYEAIAQCDIVVSATTSPHYTVHKKKLEKMPSVPLYFVDLAMPRDIDPEITQIDGVRLWNVDELKQQLDLPEEDPKPFQQAEEIIQEQVRRFNDWRSYKEGLAKHEELAAPFFPVFIHLLQKPVLVVGGGKIATRRISVLLEFGAAVRVVSPAISPEIEKMVLEAEFANGSIEWVPKKYQPGDVDGAMLVVAATNSRQVNHQVGLEARRERIPVSVADRRDECSFYFPAVIQGKTLTAGMVSQNGNHTLVRKAAVEMRERLREIEEDNSGRQQGK